jgi:hypothetical protein
VLVFESEQKGKGSLGTLGPLVNYYKKLNMRFSPAGGGDFVNLARDNDCQRPRHLAGLV